jgi:diguanylate cyclase (GGDEF)-like protein
LNVKIGDNLKDLLATDPWRDLFATLSESLGFSLSVYSPTGVQILTLSGSPSPCASFRATSPDFESQCKTFCQPRIVNTLATGKPDVFKCYSKIMTFAIPISYLDDKAVIVGQGSFSSYVDFRESMDRATANGLDSLSIRAPLVFTSRDQAWKACRFVDDTIKRLLSNLQETVALRRKFESLLSVFSLWGSAAAERPEVRYQDMLYNLSTLLDINRITLLALDRQAGRYVSLYGLSKSGAQTESLSLGTDDTVVKELLSGKPFVRSSRPPDCASCYFFPILLKGALSGILFLADRKLAERDRQIISGFCKQTALFIENFQLRQDLYKKLNRFASMSELTRAITPIQNYKTLLQMILDKSAELLRAEQGSLMLLDQKTDLLLIEAKKGMPQGVPGKIMMRRGEGIAGKVVEQGEPILVKNLESDPRIRQKNRQHYKTLSFVSVPLKIADRIIGVLNLSDKTTGEVFDEEDLKLIQSFATQAAVVLERNEFYHRSEELKKLTITDSLTGLLNRRYLLERLKDEVSRSERHNHPLSLLMLDLDGFKHCNDTRGHLFGDRMLKSVADMLLKAVRTMDIVARYGGDEFMVILPETGQDVAISIAERLKTSVAAMPVFEDGSLPACDALTASIGIVCYPDHGDSVEFLLERVDQSLYRAKNKGKNRIEVYA